MNLLSVDAKQLRNTLDTLKNNIYDKDTQNFMSAIVMQGIWGANCQINYSRSLDYLENDLYKKLKEYLAKYECIPNLVEEYNELNAKVESLDDEIEELEASKNYYSEGKQYYTVESGDNWWSIASRYDISMDELAAQNNKSTDDYIYPGETLVVGSGFDTSYIDEKIVELTAEMNAVQNRMTEINNCVDSLF